MYDQMVDRMPESGSSQNSLIFPKTSLALSRNLSQASTTFGTTVLTMYVQMEESTG